MTDITVGLRLKADGSGFVGDIRLGARELDQLRAATQRAGSAARDTSRQTDRLSDSERRAAGEARRLREATTGLRSSLFSLRNVILTLGLAKVAKDIGQAGVQMESLRATMGFAIGDTNRVGRELEFVRTQAERLGLDLLTSAQGFTQLTAAAKGTALEGEALRELFLGVSEASAVMGLRTDQVNGVILALTQIISKGVVSMEELRRQLGERLVGVMQIAAESTGKTTQEFEKLVASGQLFSEDFLPGFAAALRRHVAEGLPAAMVTARAEFERFGNAIFDLQVQIAESGFLSGVVDGVKALTEAFRDPATVQSLTELGRAVGDLTAFLGRHAGTIANVIREYGLLIAALFVVPKVFATVTAAAAALRVAIVGVGRAFVFARTVLLPFLGPAGIAASVAGGFAALAVSQIGAADAAESHAAALGRLDQKLTDVSQNSRLTELTQERTRLLKEISNIEFDLKNRAETIEAFLFANRTEIPPDISKGIISGNLDAASLALPVGGFLQGFPDFQADKETQTTLFSIAKFEEKLRVNAKELEPLKRALADVIAELEKLDGTSESLSKVGELSSDATKTVDELLSAIANVTEQQAALASGGLAGLDLANDLQQARDIVADLGANSGLTVEQVRKLITEQRKLTEELKRATRAERERGRASLDGLLKEFRERKKLAELKETTN